MVMRAAGYGAHEFERIKVLPAEERRAFHLHQIVDGDGFRLGVQIGELRDERCALMLRLSHVDDAAAADINAGLSYLR